MLVDESLRQVSSETGHSLSSLYEWKRKLNWNEREDERIQAIRSDIAKKNDAAIVENKAQYLEDLHRVLASWRRDSDDIPIRTANDLNTLMRLALFLQGGDDDQGVKIQFNTTLLKNIT